MDGVYMDMRLNHADAMSFDLLCEGTSNGWRSSKACPITHNDVKSLDVIHRETFNFSPICY